MSTPRKAFLTGSDLVKLAADIRADEKLIAEATARIESNRRLYDAGLLWAPKDFDPVAAEIEEAIFTPDANADTSVKDKALAKPSGRVWSRPTWISEVERIVDLHAKGIDKQFLLNEVLKTALGKNASNGYKGFHHALTRLTKRGKIVKHGSMFFSSRAIKAIKDRGEELPPIERKVIGSGIIVMETLGKYPTGLTGSQLQQIVGKVPEAPVSLRKHKHYIYNILASLVDSGRVIKRRGIYHVAESAQGVQH